jgi:AraC family transcriptional regulator
MLANSQADLREFSPHSKDWRCFAWPGGRFDSASRPSTPNAEGTITLAYPTLMAIIDGGCRDIEVTSDCGHRYAGADFAGSASFVQAGVPRHIKMRGVRSAWASLSIRPDLFTASDEPGKNDATRLPQFTNQNDPFLTSMLREMARLHMKADGLEAIYCEAMALSAVHYVLHRYTGTAPRPARAFPGWRLRRAKDHMAAHLSDPQLQLQNVAQSVGLSTGFFHRAFKETTGETPLAYIQRQRIELAIPLLAQPELSIATTALRAGFLSPSHFARLFRRQVGVTPSQYRRDRC